MTWFFFSLLSAIFLSSSNLIEKKALDQIHTIHFSAALAFMHVVFVFPLAFFVDWSKVDSLTFFLMFGTACLAALAFYTASKALKHFEISFVSPLLALSPAIVSILGFLMLGEEPTRLGLLGIILMVFGSYILALGQENKTGHILTIFAKSKYLPHALLALLFFSLGAIVDRFILADLEVPVVNYLFFTQLFIAILFMPALFILGDGFAPVEQALRKHPGKIFLASIFLFVSRFFELHALSVAFAGLVSAIKRSSAFFSTLIGGELFHEKNLRRKILASMIIIFGTFLLLV